MGADEKTTGDTTVGSPMPQAHGGVLRRGGPNKGGPGRPPSKIRELCREKFEKRIPTLDRIAASRKEKTADKIRAIEVLGRFGLDPSVRVADVKECLRQQSAIIRELLPEAQSEALLQQLRPVWLNL